MNGAASSRALASQRRECAQVVLTEHSAHGQGIAPLSFSLVWHSLYSSARPAVGVSLTFLLKLAFLSCELSKRCLLSAFWAALFLWLL